MIKPRISAVNGNFSQIPKGGKHFPERFTEVPGAVIVKEENHMMNDKISRLGLLFIIVGFFMLCVSYAIENFDILYSVDPGYLSALGGFTLTTGMLILAVTGTIYILKMLVKRFTRK